MTYLGYQIFKKKKKIERDNAGHTTKNSPFFCASLERGRKTPPLFVLCRDEREREREKQKPRTKKPLISVVSI